MSANLDAIHHAAGDCATGSLILPTKTAPKHPLPRTVIEAGRGGRSIELAELWQFRELLWVLTARDIKARYRQSLLGALWTVIQPLLTLTIFCTLFHFMGRTPTMAGVPYVASVLCALLIWNFFSTIAAQAAHSLQANGGLIKKVYCPRLIFPACTVLVALVDLVVGFVVLAVLMIYYGVMPGWALLTIPIFVVMAAGLGLAVGLWVSALSIRHRDMRFMLPAILQMWFYCSPVIYDTSTLIPARLRPIYDLNPLAGILEGFRWSVLGTSNFSWSMFAIAGPLLVALLVGGLFYFRRLEQTIADHL